MRGTIHDALAGFLAGSAAFAFVVLFVLTRAGVAPLWLALAIATVGFAAALIAVGVDGLRTILRPDNQWWLERVETALEGTWNGYADTVLVGGLTVTGVVAAALLLVDPTAERAPGLLLVAFFGLNGALFVFAVARY